MAADGEQETLDRILGELQTKDRRRCLQALEELSSLKFSSPAILQQIEQLAIHHPDEEVHRKAVASLRTSIHQFVRRELNTLNRGDRVLLLKQILKWEEDGLIPPHFAEVINARYDFDVVAPRAAPEPASPIQQAQPLIPISAPPDIRSGPRLTLTETLLSEASIRIYLYLGAFFVIAAALILAAVVEAARFPILAAATLLFGGGALLLRRRLPQPSFALFIVFSFLLPIDANVVEETLGLTKPALSVYWTFLFLMMAVIWGFSVWFYQSRFFSAVAFVALSLAFYRSGEIFNAEAELYIFLGMLASLAGLAGTLVLKKWKDTKLSLFVFLLAQTQVLGLLFLSLAFALIDIFDSNRANEWWLLVSLTWLFAASFFVLSDLLIPFLLFPWMAVAALLPLPWFFLNTFDVMQPAYAIGFLVWGTVLAFASEIVLRFPMEKFGKYYGALLAGSLLSVLTALSTALEWDEAGLIFAALISAALVYGVLYMLRPRWYVWSLMLLSASAAFFTFFHLPVIEALAVPLVYQLSIASILLVVPELFTRSPLTLKLEPRWLTVALGIFVSLFGILAALVDFENLGRGALVLFLYAVLFTLHALQGKREWLGYFAAVLESLALVYALEHFGLDLWLPALTALSVTYYAAGFFFRRRTDEINVWGTILINSGLALGLLISSTSLFLSKESSGWYIILIALSFAVEVFARPLAWLELGVELLLSISLYLILDDFNTTRIGHFLFGTSLIWLGGDLIVGYLLKEKRVYRPITLGAGFVLVTMAAMVLWGELSPVAPTIYFSLYAVFFATYAFLKREPRLGYLATAFLPLAIPKFADLLNFDKWIFPLILLAVVYYAAGYGWRRGQKAAGWDQLFLYSGLGLGTITSLIAPLQGGLDLSIPVAIAATLFAVEAFARRSAWWAFPANGLYLLAYFMILWEVNVDDPQYYSVGASLLGMLMHYLLTRAASKTGAFSTGMLSQLVLLGTTYIQMIGTEKLSFFFVLFTQSMVVLVYGLIQRSRSLVITPIAFAVIGVMTVIYSALKGLGPVILIGSTGILLLLAGIVAVLMRERITKLGEQLSDWKP